MVTAAAPLPPRTTLRRRGPRPGPPAPRAPLHRVVSSDQARWQTLADGGDNIAKDVQSHYIRGACLKQPNFNSKTYANKYKQHIYDGNACPEHRDVNWMV